MEISQLRYFLEVAKRQHVTESARALNVVQPAITQSINRLETELGVELFMHSGRNIRLTACGKFLYDEVYPFLKALDELPEKIRALNRTDGFTARINILSAWSLVTKAIIEYQRIDHMLQIELSESEPLDMADISVTTSKATGSSKSIKAQNDCTVFNERIFLAVPNIPQYRDVKSIDLKEMRNSRFITLSGVKDFRNICDQFLLQAGIRPRYVFESDSPSSVMNAISARMGVGFWPAFSWKRPDPRSILLLEVQKPVCSRDIAITYTRTKKDDIHVRLFYEFLCGYFKVYSGKQDFQSLMSKSS